MRTPYGSLTKSMTFKELERQGTVLTPLKCAVAIDTVGKETLNDTSDYIYKYRDSVKIPPLGMIDDILTVTKCGKDSVIMNAIIQSKVDIKRLELGSSKCSKLHIGNKKKLACLKLNVYDTEMKTVQYDSYLRDIIFDDTKLDENIKARSDKGKGICNQIMSLIKLLSFGSFYFEMGLFFRSSMLINGTLYSLEPIPGINDKHLKSLKENG